MEIINLLAGTGAKPPLSGKASNGAEPGAQFASVLENATNAHGSTRKGLTLLTASDPHAEAAAKDIADKTPRVKFDAADLLASKDINADGKDAPKADPKHAEKPDAKAAQKTAKNDDRDDKGKHAHHADAVNPNTPIAAAINAALATVAGQSQQNTRSADAKGAASVQKGSEVKTGKLANAGTQGGSRHQLQQLQQTTQAATSAAASSHAGSDAGTSSGGHGFASQLLSATDASTQAAAPVHTDNSVASPAINGLLNATAMPQTVVPANPPSPAYTATLQAPIGSMPWQNQLGQQLIRFSQRGAHQIELQLHPKELGPLQISLHVNDQVAQAHFFAAHAQVRDAVQQAVPQLREALAGQGIALGEAMVGQQQQQRQEPGSFTGSPASSSFGGVTEVENVAPTHPVGSRLPLVGGTGVDLYA